jgi:Homeobox KN domain
MIIAAAKMTTPLQLKKMPESGGTLINGHATSPEISRVPPNIRVIACPDHSVSKPSLLGSSSPSALIECGVATMAQVRAQLLLNTVQNVGDWPADAAMQVTTLYEDISQSIIQTRLVGGCISIDLIRLRDVLRQVASLCQVRIRLINEYQPASLSANLSRPALQRRHRLNARAPRDALKRWFLQNTSNPYPTRVQKEQLSAESGMSMRAINKWFVDARHRRT